MPIDAPPLRSRSGTPGRNLLFDFIGDRCCPEPWYERHAKRASRATPKASRKVGRVGALLFAVNGSDREHPGVGRLRDRDLNPSLIIPDHD